MCQCVASLRDPLETCARFATIFFAETVINLVSIIEKQDQSSGAGHTVGPGETTEIVEESHVPGDHAISFLPLSPVNCAKALEKDELVSRFCKGSEPYILAVTLNCSACGS